MNDPQSYARLDILPHDIKNKHMHKSVSTVI